jgi:type IV pilus assembly protein PilN
MRLTINLATRIYINTRRLNYIVVAAFALMIFLLLANVRNIATDLGELRLLNQRIAKLEAKTMKSANEAVVPDKEYQALLASIKFANGLIEQKTFNWLMLLDKLEGIVPDGVAIVSIEPSPKDEGLKLEGIAKNFGNLRKFMENLEDSKYFTDIYLLGQADTLVLPGQTGIGFHITCKAKFK